MMDELPLPNATQVESFWDVVLDSPCPVLIAIALIVVVAGVYRWVRR